MGLDVTWYRKLREVPGCVGEDGGSYCDDHVRLWDHPDFPGRSDGIKCGVCYNVAKEDCGDAGSWSYSGYNRWREAVSMLALGVMPRRVWDNPEDFAGQPFAELIHFADNEGTIGPVVAARLAVDFATYDDKARDVMDEWDYKRYRMMADGCAAAADGGALLFH